MMSDLIETEAQILRRALERLERAAAEVSRYGAQTGPQWSKLSGALISARVAMMTSGRAPAGEVGEGRIENCNIEFGVGVERTDGGRGRIFVRENLLARDYDGPALREFMQRIVQAWSSQLGLSDSKTKTLSIPLLDPPYAEEHPLLAPIIAKRARAAGNFTPEFSGQRGADFDRGLLCAFEAVNGELQRLTAEAK